MNAWIMLVIAGLLEVVWAVGLKHTAGFTRLWPSVLTILAMLASFFLLARAMQTLPLSVSYTVWVGIGAVGSAIAGVLLFSEKLSPAQWVCLGLIALSIAGLKFLAPPSQPAPPPATTTP